MRMIIKLFLVSLLMLPATAFSLEKGLTVKSVRYFSYSAFTRIVFELEAAAPYVLAKTAEGQALLLKSAEGQLTIQSAMPAIKDGIVSGVEAKEENGQSFIIIRFDAVAGDVKDFVLRGPDRIVLDVSRGGTSAPGAVTAAEQPVIERNKIIIVLDAGHGGRDTGIVTVQGQEKSMTSDLAQAIKKILQKDQRLKVVMTRDKDAAVTLDERAAVANGAGALVFVSIHGAPGTGVRIYIQDPEDDPDSPVQRAASRDFLGFESGSRQQEKLWGRQQASHAQESGALGRRIARQLSGAEDAEPIQAPLAGLRPVNAAAVMIEVGMNQDKSGAAQAIAKGIELYVGAN